MNPSAFRKAIGQSNWTVFTVFAVLFFLFTLIFEALAFRHIACPSPIGAPLAFLGYLLPKVAGALLFASLCFLPRDNRWLILLSIALGVWMEANLVYMRNKGIVLDASAFDMSGNLHGYGNSSFIYLRWQTDWIPWALMLLCCSVFFVAKTRTHSWKRWGMVILIAIGIHYAGQACYVASHPKAKFSLNSIGQQHRDRCYGIHFPNTVRQTSYLHAPLFVLSDYIDMQIGKRPYRPIREADRAMIATRTNTNYGYRNNSPLLIIMLESFENWVLREDVMPSLYAFSQHEHVLYMPHVKTQIIAAPSSDGRLIVNTGLLPISQSATCLNYNQDTFPGLMRLTDEPSLMLLPNPTKVWQQEQMSHAYGYDTTVSYCDLDSLLFPRLLQYVDSGYRHLLCVSQSTHAPFVSHKLSQLETPKGMPKVMKHYIKAFNALDHNLAPVLDAILNDSLLSTFTVVLAADHRILSPESRDDFHAYCKKTGLDYKPKDKRIACLIYSPRIQGNVRVEEDCYQMDIYPTILHLLGADHPTRGYQWRGLGVNVLNNRCSAVNTEGLLNRTISEEEAYRLSDKMIRNNDFRGLIP